MIKQKISALITAGIIASLLLNVSPQVVNAETKKEVTVDGSITATTIVLTVSTSLDFAIDMNRTPLPGTEAGLFTTPADIINETPAPVDVDILGIVSVPGNTTKVVDKTKFPDWNALGVADTVSNIALGVKVGAAAEALWATAEDTNDLSTPIGSFPLKSSETVSIVLDSKFGKSWTETKELNYLLKLRVSLKD